MHQHSTAHGACTQRTPRNRHASTDTDVVCARIPLQPASARALPPSEAHARRHQPLFWPFALVCLPCCLRVRRFVVLTGAVSANDCQRRAGNAGQTAPCTEEPPSAPTEKLPREASTVRGRRTERMDGPRNSCGVGWRTQPQPPQATLPASLSAPASSPLVGAVRVPAVTDVTEITYSGMRK
jgi:hypothetical protein